MEVCGALPVVCQPSISAKMCAKTVAASAFGWNGDGFKAQCPWPKKIVSFDRVGEARRCDRGPHV